MTEVDFHQIRKHETSQEEGFEELCCQIFSLCPPTPDAQWVRKRGAGGDAGVEAYWTLPDGTEHALQAKYFFKLEQAQRAQLTKSVKAMLDRHPLCSIYYVCIPFNLSEPRHDEKWSERKHWDTLVKKWKSLKPGRDIEFKLWDATELGKLLTLDEPNFSGRRHYWFNDKILSQDWLNKRLNEAVRNLGDRYTPDMHVDLPITQKFAATLHHDAFWGALAAVPGQPRSYTKNEALQRIENCVVEKTTRVANLIGWACKHRVLGNAITESESLLHEATRAIRDSEFGVGKAATTVPELSREERSDYHQLVEGVSAFRRHLQEVESDFAAFSAVILLGDAGVGKSHLLADVSLKAIELQCPAILVLGQQFYSGQPWDFILRALDFPGTAEEFLGALDSAAQARGCRALLAIDALNEGAGNKIWPNELPGFVERVSHFPHIALVVSCRASYQRRITRNLGPRQMFELWHHGFSGHEDTAAKVYLDRKGISRPDTPFLDPEFSNPLFLKTICEALERAGEHRFPKGLKGVTQIFDFYIQSVASAIEDRLDLDEDQNLVRQAIDAITDEMLASGTDYLRRKLAQSITDGILASNGSSERNLVVQLKSEGVLTDDVIYSGIDDATGVNVVRIFIRALPGPFSRQAFHR